MKTHLLLSGGGALGAFQAGALRAVQEAIDAGIVHKPSDAIGISVGALNAALCSINHHDLRWVSSFWYKNIRKPSDIAINKSMVLRVLPGVLRGKFDGLVDPSPLRKMIDRYLSLEALYESPIRPHAGTVHINSGRLFYATPDNKDYLGYLMASASIPAIFPTVEINGEPWSDGGLVEVAPATRCIEQGADRIIVILCQPVDSERQAIDAYDPWDLAERLMDIITISSLEKDVRTIEAMNQAIKRVHADASRLLLEKPQLTSQNILVSDLKRERGLLGMRIVQKTIIRPDRPLGYNTGAFNEDQIGKAIDHGYTVARRELGLDSSLLAG